MKHTKRLLTVLLMALLCAVLVLAVSAQGDVTIVDSGYCGEWDPSMESFLETIHWTFYDNGTITFEGTGVLRRGYVAKNEQGMIIDKLVPPWWANYHTDIISVEIYNGITDIGGFDYCENLLRVDLPESVKIIGDDAFYCSSSLKEIEIPYGMTEIGARAFAGCSSLEKIDIPNTVTSIGEHAFSSCVGLTSVTIPDSVICIEDSTFSSCTGLTSVTIPNSITRIGAYAFSDCENLLNVMIPDSVTSVGCYAFNSCNLSTIHIGKGVQEIGDSAFFDTKQIEVDEENHYYSSVDGVLFNKDKTDLLCYPFANPREEYTVLNSVRKIGYRAFRENKTLEKLLFQEGLTEIEEEAIVVCPKIEEYTFPTSLNRIGKNNFAERFVYPCLYTVKSMNTEFGEGVFSSGFRFKNNLSMDLQREILFAAFGLAEPSEKIQEYLNNIDEYMELSDYENGEHFYVGTIRCHAGSTAEAYAIEHGMNYELVHFYEGDWNYDWDNLIRWRKCIHCDERETEPLETETSGGAEIVAPVDDDTSFDVESVSTDYVLIRETLGEMNVVKAFDITLKNSDGVHVQPKGTVKVKLPNDFKSESYKVYRVNPDGTYTDMNAFREGSHLVFYTDHFSLYVIVDESAPAAPDEPSSNSDKDKTPDQPSGKICKYCGQTHTGFPGILIGFFHSILALFGLKK